MRLLDRGFFRIGSEQYTVQNESFGLATMRKEHVTLDPEHRGMVFDYTAKSGKRRIQGVVDPAAFEVVAALKRRRGGGPELLAYKNGRRGPTCARPTSTSTSRTPPATTSRPRTSAPGRRRCWRRSRWRSRARSRPPKTGRKRAVVRAVKEVSHYLGNTPAVCRASYIDPRVIDAYNGGLIIRGVLEEIADTAAARRAADPPAGRRGGGARPAQRAGGVAGSGADRGLSAARVLLLAQAPEQQLQRGPAGDAVDDDRDDHARDRRPHERALLAAGARPRSTTVAA